MFAKSFIALAAVASFAVAAPIEKKGAPAGWAYGYLEDYDTYHTRYLALKCYDHKKTDFFQDCCRPMLSTETLAANRKSYCVPSAEDSAAAAATPSASASANAASESEYCDSEESASSAAPTNAKVAAAATSSSTTATATASPAAESKAGENYVAAAKSSSTTTTSSTPAWTPAPTTAAPTTQAPATTAAPTTAASSSGETFTGGYATYFYQGGNAGACGTVHGDGDMIVAIDQARWGSSSFGGGSSTCGKWVTITNTNNGKSVSAMIADVCPTCTNGNSLDLSQGAFRAIASDADGMVPISWHWN